MNLDSLKGRALVALVIMLISAPLSAAEIRLEPDQPLQEVLDNARAGDRIVLAAGKYQGNFRIEKPLELVGEPGAVLDGGGIDNVLYVDAPGVRVEGLTIRGSGVNLTDLDSAIFITPEGEGVHIIGNRIEESASGIWLDSCDNWRVVGNRISGRIDLRSQDRGNGIHLSNTHGGYVADNEIWQVRDGIYIETSDNSTLHANEMYDLRYGIHYMYAHDNAVTDNYTHDTRTGYALMQSRRLTVTGNRSERDQNYGMLLNFITDSTISRNRVSDARIGTNLAGGDIEGADGKALFVYNAPYNEIQGNLLARSDIGIHLTAGSEGNQFWENAFVGNRTQVKYVVNREQEWSRDGRGNYWSDYLGWDRDADGVGDRPYEPNDAVDALFWRFPLARMLMNSPAVEILRWVQQQFPVLKPQGVRDSYPLMVPPEFVEIR
ncbi:nitrous oxide reductase family maturation protein NosD [Thiohalomonas denitrificans]|uniref:nitrous oxide reductase family maturation protein NosD n=1 Tax=Thiohalomonas denitrificans TaxID=415747 RepID=UPI0026EFF8B2|nr:nitrous oxide reductase family maturation protein NosD [Thiohalomonas denitrificans]